MSGIAICTLVRGREEHLVRMLRGCQEQTRAADRHAVALMQASVPDLPSDLAELCSFVHIGGDKLPLAKARNAAAALAEPSDKLIFLDVDCIPGPGFNKAMAELLDDGVCLMADCRYLGGNIDHSAPFTDLWQKSDKHPARPVYAPSLAEPTLPLGETTELWSLGFGLTKHDFDRAGGFDEAFYGYGGEDTDFALRLGQAGIALHYAPQARAVHQWHEVSKPPLGHFDDIVRNAQLFRQKHGRWCMDYWLHQLAAEGFITWTEEKIEVLRKPSLRDLEAARCGPGVRFS